MSIQKIVQWAKPSHIDQKLKDHIFLRTLNEKNADGLQVETKNKIITLTNALAKFPIISAQ